MVISVGAVVSAEELMKLGVGVLLVLSVMGVVDFFAMVSSQVPTLSGQWGHTASAGACKQKG
jgi:hypothetical protein